MYLKSIEIQGFKSFANKTVLDFSAPKVGRNSVTCVVGPNGSGKSNISDAIRWVMGEQSMKSLRSKKGEDVIFAGSQSKGQLSVASVSLVLDNTDGADISDYDEIVITRRYYRSGDSEYLINGKSVRLIDLQILLAKAQFGQGSYSVVGQGTIDRMLLQTPAERKDFFDEASGIKEFQIKRHQASLKLNRTDDNLEQAEMLLNEVSPRLRSLSRQVKKLEQRKDLELQLLEWQESFYYTIFLNNDNKLQESYNSIKIFETEQTDIQNKLNIIQTELATLARDDSRQDQFEKLENEYQKVIKQKNNLEKEKAILQGRLQTEYSKVGKQNLAWLGEKIENLTQEKTVINTELTSVEKEIEKLTADIIDNKKELEQQQIEKTEINNFIFNLQNQINNIKSQQNYFQYSGLRAVKAILENRNNFGKVYGTVAQLGEVEDDYRMALDVASGSRLSSLVVDGDRVAQKCIDYLRQNHLGVATFLPINKIKPRFASLDIKSLLDHDGVIGLAIDLLKFDEKFFNIFSYVLGNTLVVEDIDTAREIGIGRVRMVTLGGDILETSGSIKGGFRNKDKLSDLGYSSQPIESLGADDEQTKQEKINSLQNKLLDLNNNINKKQDYLNSLQSGLQVNTSKMDMFGERLQRTEKELSGFEQEKSLHTMSKEEYTEGLKLVAEQKQEIDKSLLDLEKSEKTIKEKIERFNNEQEEKKNRIFSLQETMQEVQNQLNLVIENKNEQKVVVARLETKKEDLENEIYQELRSSHKYLLDKQPKLLETSDELDLAQQKIQKIKYQLSLIGGIDEEVLHEYKETKEKHDNLLDQLEDLKSAKEDLGEMVSELDKVMKQKRGQAFKEIKKEFSRYFSVLFEGGKADLVEIYGEEYLDDEIELDIDQPKEIDLEIEDKKSKRKNKKILTGIDVVANPPGKKIKNIQALSGGERTLTSIALVCAILSINPSPFVVLDEVEAALDEANTLRFTAILQELVQKSQFILITHNKATMHSADTLYGVTMGSDGVSKLLSVELGQ